MLERRILTGGKLYGASLDYRKFDPSPCPLPEYRARVRREGSGLPEYFSAERKVETRRSMGGL